MKRIAVLASGGGSNLQSLINNCESGYIPAEIALVISDNESAMALTRAKKHGVEALCVDPGDYGSREDYDAALVDEIKGRGVDLICLAGYMKILTPVFVRAFPEMILNIHPALLPSFPGTHGQKDALEYGVKVSGCTVHFVDEQVDHGPIVIQAAVPVSDDDTVESLASRILRQEHSIFPKAVKWFCEGKLKLEDRRVLVRGEAAGILVSESRGC